MNTKTLKNQRDLEQYGIKLLTGESDPYSFRGLYDLTEKGVEFLSEFFGGMDLTPALARNWNSGAIRSILLPYSLLGDLFRFALFHIEHCEKMVIVSGQYIGTSAENVEKNREDWEHVYGQDQVSIYTNYNLQGRNRNVHQMSGRDV